MRIILLIMLGGLGCSSLAKIQKQCRQDPAALGYYDEVECIRGERAMRTERWRRFSEGVSEHNQKRRDREINCTSRRYGRTVYTDCD